MSVQLRVISTVIIKGAGTGSDVVVWDRDDNLKEAYKQLRDKEVYEKVPNNPNVLVNTIMKFLEKIRLRSNLSSDIVNCFYFFWLRILNSLDFTFYLKFISVYKMYLSD